MHIKKTDFFIFLFAAVFIGAVLGYILARVPAAGTFEISTDNIALVPSPVVISPDVTYDPIYRETPEEDALPVSEVASRGSDSPVLVNINTAVTDELQTLPGIGEVMAERIISEREANGRFISVEDLLRVNGIGEKMLETLKPYITY